jgi:hypothetical protein
MAAIRTKDVYLAGQYARLRPRRGHKKALGAVKHAILIACWHMLSTGELSTDLGGDYFRKRDPNASPNDSSRSWRASVTRSFSSSYRRPPNRQPP